MKNLLFILLVISVLSGCSVANSLRMMYANKNIEPVLPVLGSESFEANVQAFYIGEKPYIKVEANKQEELLFLIDTGASFTMLFDTHASSQLTFKRGFDLELRGWGDGENSPAYQTELESLAIGDVLFENVKVGFIPISTSPYYLRPEEAIFDGVLGHDLLKHFNWKFDKQNKKITLTTKSFPVEASDVKVPIKQFFSKLKMPVTLYIDGKNFEQDVFIDTGSRHYFKFNTAFVENNDITLPSARISASDFGLSGEAKHIRVRLPKLSIGDMTLKGVKSNVIYAEDEEDFSVVGSALMNQFVTIIDYQNDFIVFRPYSDSRFSSLYNLAGLDLRKLQGGKLLVRHVFPGLVADKNGFTAGMVVTSINGVSTTEITEEDWLRMSAQPASFSFCFEKQQCTTITTQHISGYSTAL
jgi:predicted aspartyl protease